jgi:dienelactone hydrolase
MAGRKRYLSPFDTVQGWIKGEKPRLKFSGKTVEDWRTWRKQFRASILKQLGSMPEQVPLRAETVRTDDMGEYVREKIIFDTEKYASVPAFVLVPKFLKRGEQRPAVLAAHGHGIGKNPLVGLDENERPHSDYQHQLAVQLVKRGYVVIAPDWRGFGERQSPQEWVRGGRDRCNVNYLAEGYRGYHLIALQIWDAMKTVDYLQTRKEVDPKRIGCVGVSFGGTMTTYLSALDKRIKCACISGYVSTVRDDALGLRGLGNTCGVQYMPGLLTIGDIADVAGLIAPRPLVVEMGEQDTCFVIDDVLKGYRHLSKIYNAAGARDRLVKDQFNGEHQFSGAVSLDWFDKWLR